jgi:hypothetical protein
MGYTLKVEHPHFPEGTVFNVGGLDRIPNGSTLDVDDEQERLFVMTQGKTLEDAFANDATISVSGSSALDRDELDSLLEAYGATIETEEVNNGESEEVPAWMQNDTSGGNDTPDDGGELNA